MNLCNVNKLYLSHPFVRSDHINHHIFNDMINKYINENSIQRNGGPFRIIISSILLLIDSKIYQIPKIDNQSAKSSFVSDSTDLRLIKDLTDNKQYVLLDLLLIFMIGCDDVYFFRKLFSNIYEKAPIEESKLCIYSIFNIDPKFTVENSCAELNSKFNRWNELKTASTYLIYFKSHTKTEDKDCILQNSDFIVFFIINTLLNSLLQNRDATNAFKLDVWNCFRRIIIISQRNYQNEGRNLVDVINQFLDSLLVIDIKGNINSESSSCTSNERISQEVKYEIELLIEADKSVDEDTKQFNKFKMDKMSFRY